MPAGRKRKATPYIPQPWIDSSTDDEEHQHGVRGAVQVLGRGVNPNPEEEHHGDLPPGPFGPINPNPVEEYRGNLPPGPVGPINPNPVEEDRGNLAPDPVEHINPNGVQDSVDDHAELHGGGVDELSGLHGLLDDQGELHGGGDNDIYLDEGNFF